MSETSALVPEQAEDGYTPLGELATRALQRYGDFGVQPADPVLAILMIDMANEIIEEIRQHPYRPVDSDGNHVELSYYEALADVREIPDLIIYHGLLAKYAAQQGSAKVQQYAPAYFRTMNQLLYNRRYGNQVITLRPVDGGSNRSLGEDNAFVPAVGER